MFIKNDACDWKKKSIEDHDHGRKKSWNWIEQANSDPWIQTMTKSENGIHKNAFKMFLVIWKHTMVCEILVSM